MQKSFQLYLVHNSQSKKSKFGPPKKSGHTIVLDGDSFANGGRRMRFFGVSPANVGNVGLGRVWLRRVRIVLRVGGGARDRRSRGARSSRTGRSVRVVRSHRGIRFVIHRSATLRMIFGRGRSARRRSRGVRHTRRIRRTRSLIITCYFKTINSGY